MPNINKKKLHKNVSIEESSEEEESPQFNFNGRSKMRKQFSVKPLQMKKSEIIPEIPQPKLTIKHSLKTNTKLPQDSERSSKYNENLRRKNDRNSHKYLNQDIITSNDPKPSERNIS